MIPSLVCAIKQTKRSFDNNYMKILWKKNTKNVSSKVAEKKVNCHRNCIMMMRFYPSMASI